MKKILILANYFYPDKVAFVPLITDLCESLSKNYKIIVIAAGEEQKNILQRERYNQNIEVIRVKTPSIDKKNKLSRIRYILYYFINSIYAVFKEKKIDLIYTVSQPPILGGVLGVISKIIKRKPLIYNIQDFNPEAIEAIAYSKNKILIKILKFIDNTSCRFSDVVIVVGRDMKDKFYERYTYKKTPQVNVINNWADENELYPIDKNNLEVLKMKKENNLENKLIIMYSGNIGLFYGLEEIIEVFSKFEKEKDLIFLFVGEGAIKDKLVSYVKDKGLNNFKFLPYQDRDKLKYSLNLADVHLVTNAKGIKGVSVPSKIYGVLSVGKPILGVLEYSSEARTIIEEVGCGFVSEPGDFNKLEINIKEILENRDKLKKMGDLGREILEKKYTKDKSIQKYLKIIEEII